MRYIFGKKRKDGQLVKDGDPMTRIMPYIMRSRNESVIYYRNTIKVGPIRDYIKVRRKKSERITVFNVIMTAILNVLVLRPHLNRFVAGRRIYQHNSYDALYMVKLDMSDQAYESVARVSMHKNDQISSIAEKMQEQVNLIRDEEKNKTDDNLISIFTKTPRWLNRTLVQILRWADFHGFLPTYLMKNIPLYSSVFVSHLGSIGGHPPFHHLYEVGTNSIFLTLGKVYDKPFRGKNDEVEWCEVIDLAFTIDERICDGYYLMKSLNIFDRLLENPELLALTPNEIAKYMESEDIVFGNRRLNISDKLKERLNISQENITYESRVIFDDDEIIESDDQ
ncbi:MAG TPA: 2-oxo acid dehydrogenase subunit E2 [Candidatus Eisenbacteria bacterium]|nr:2-oxo acid dehydrogenase subunit E2 [Candidatus Eisenbacteria bacterium]